MIEQSVPQSTDKLIGHLPLVRGSYIERADLSRYSRFRVGGPAEILFKPADVDDLQLFMSSTSPAIPITVIGVGSNILIRNGGVNGVVVRLGRNFSDISVNDTKIRTGAGALDLNVARFAQRHTISGLEFLSGIPGSIGGTLKMNGGAYGREIGDIIVTATVVDRCGNLSILDHTNLDFSYRHCGVPADCIFLAAELDGVQGNRQEISTLMDAIAKTRIESQPTRGATGGSTFKNPQGLKAWEVIDEAGCRGLRLGGAIVSEKHCNFLINEGQATASELEALAEEVRQRVFNKCGIMLEWEIQRIGNAEIHQ